MHEDGGKMAVYESNREVRAFISPFTRPSYFISILSQGVQSYNKGSVLLGPAYIVVACNCSLDSSLKAYSEWCEWCRCDSCGGKVISKSLRASMQGYNNSDDFPPHRTAPDLSSDLALLVILVVTSTWGVLYASSLPYRQAYLVGAAAAGFTLTRLAKWFGY